MGGDHKCPVCQATFTRPQHVARHMRSHTGDRPYKCQFCGDQFARSDLLSRHINKCHANEKPVPVQGRRKGATSASRATTSKQACDQCVQSSLPCDGSNPCVKCVQRKCRCTYVKFHRQTAPVGPGHNPRPTVPVIPANSAAISSRLPMSYPSDDFFLQPPPSSVSVADPLYPSQTFSFPALYPDPVNAAPSQDFTSKYRAQAELLRNGAASAPSSAHFAPAGGGGSVGPGLSHLYNDPRSASSWAPWGQDNPNSYHQQDPLHDKDIHRGHDPLSHRSQHHHPYLNSQGLPHALQHSSSGAGTTYPHQVQSSSAYMRRGSVEFGSSSEGSHESPSTAEHSIPSSAASSNVQLPLDNLTMQQPHHPLPYNPLDNLSDHHPDYSAQISATSRHDQISGLHQQHGKLNRGEPGVSSAIRYMSWDDPIDFAGLANANAAATNSSVATTSFFPGMMNLENGDAISSLSQVPADDPDATPMPLKENPPTVPLSAPPVAMSLPLRSSSVGGSAAAGATGANNMFINQGNNGEPKEFREFWKQYVRTPLSGPDAAGVPPMTSPLSSSVGAAVMSPPPGMGGYRRQRVASMPSSKTPAIAMSLQPPHLQQHQQRQNDRTAGSGGESGVRTTLNEDLKSYEAAVMARKAPTHLNLVPKIRRGTVPVLPPSPSSASGAGFGGGGLQGSPVGVPPPIKFDALLHTHHQQQLQYSSRDGRPGSSSTDRSGSSGEGGPSFPLTAAYMRPQPHHHPHSPPVPQNHQQHQQPLQSPHLSGPQFMMRRASPSNSSTSTTGGESSSRASSVAVDDGPDDQDNNSDDGYSGGKHGKGKRRPSFKRLASTTLEPVRTKRRAAMGRRGPTSPTTIEISSGDDGDGEEVESPTSDIDVTQGFASTALGIH